MPEVQVQDVFRQVPKLTTQEVLKHVPRVQVQQVERLWKSTKRRRLRRS